MGMLKVQVVLWYIQRKVPFFRMVSIFQDVSDGWKTLQCFQKRHRYQLQSEFLLCLVSVFSVVFRVFLMPIWEICRKTLKQVLKYKTFNEKVEESFKINYCNTYCFVISN